MVSERQWSDIIGVLKVQHKLLDFNYLKKWTSLLNLNDLLLKAFRDAGIKN